MIMLMPTRFEMRSNGVVSEAAARPGEAVALRTSLARMIIESRVKQKFGKCKREVP